MPEPSLLGAWLVGLVFFVPVVWVVALAFSRMELSDRCAGLVFVGGVLLEVLLIGLLLGVLAR